MSKSVWICDECGRRLGTDIPTGAIHSIKGQCPVCKEDNKTLHPRTLYKIPEDGVTVE